MAGVFQWQGSGGNWLQVYRGLSSHFVDGDFYTALSAPAGQTLQISFDASADTGEAASSPYRVTLTSGQHVLLTSDSYSLAGDRPVRFDASVFTAAVNLASGPSADFLIGGSAADRLRGGLGADTLTGGAGDDVFAGTLAEMSGDMITDFALGDALEIFDAAGRTAVLGDGNVLTIGGVDITLDPSADYSGYVLRQGDLFGYRTLSFALPSVSITAIDADKAEGPAGQVAAFTFRVTRDGPLDDVASVTWTVSGGWGDAADADDFVAVTGLAEFAAGEDSVDITVEVKGDDAREPHENFTVALSDPQGVALGVESEAYGWIRNDDGPNQTVAIEADAMWTSLLGAEGWRDEGREMSVELARSGDLSEALQIVWSVGPAASGASADAADFEGGVWPSGAALFTPGSSTTIVRFHVRGDADHEPDERFVFSIDPDPAAADFDPDALRIEGRILNDDAVSTPKVSIRSAAPNQVEGDEGDETVFTFTVERSGTDLSQWTYVDWTLAPRGAHPAGLDDMIDDQDYEGSLTFAPGETVKTIVLTTKGDAEPEADETFSIIITARGAEVEIDRVNGTIVDDDSPVPEPEPQPEPQPEPEPQPQPQPEPQPSLTPGQIQGGFNTAAGLEPGSAKGASPTLVLGDGSVVSNPLFAAQQALTDLIARFTAGLATREQLLEGVVDLARPTSAVALQAYQFFTGQAPTEAGLSWLVDSPDNPNDLTDAYYARFNETNRYLNFAVNLGVLGEGAGTFSHDYAALDFPAAVLKAYDVVIGLDQAGAAGVEVDAAVAWLTSQQAYFEAFAGSALGGKAAMVGYLMFAGMEAKVGRYFEATHDWLEAAFEGDGAYGVPLLGGGQISPATADLV